MEKLFHGIIHGNSIEIPEALGFADGQQVEVVVKPINTQTPWGEGIRRTAGAAAEISEFDGVFEAIEKERKSANFRKVGE